MAGSPAHFPTDATRRCVELLTACGDPQEDIALAIGISVSTLKKYYREEMRSGKQKRDCEVKESLFRMAVSGRFPAATFFYLKTQCGWRETDNLDITSKGESINTMSPEEIERRALAILARRTRDSRSVDEAE